MSNGLAFAAVTAAIQRLLMRRLTAELPPGTPGELNLGAARVTILPPDRAHQSAEHAHRLNLFLHLVRPNAALRNAAWPGGPRVRPPQAFELHYLLSATAHGDDEAAAQVLLGQALRILDDAPVLAPADLGAAIAGGDVHLQVEQVRLSFIPLAIEELSRLWQLFHVPYRLSAALQASVVLLGSVTPARAPLPVLRRQVNVEPTLAASSPTVAEIELPEARAAAHLGDPVVLRGQALAGDRVVVRVRHPRWSAAIDLSAGPGSTAEALAVALPEDPAGWPAGVYTLAVVVTRGAAVRVSNSVALPLAPRLLGPLPLVVQRAGDGSVALPLQFSPRAWPGQEVALLIGDREVTVDPREAPIDALTLVVPRAEPGEHWLRLRVDGVESDLIDRAAAPPRFAADRKAVIDP